MTETHDQIIARWKRDGLNIRTEGPLGIVETSFSPGHIKSFIAVGKKISFLKHYNDFEIIVYTAHYKITQMFLAQEGVDDYKIQKLYKIDGAIKQVIALTERIIKENRIDKFDKELQTKGEDT